jgi:hypothetical protein
MKLNKLLLNIMCLSVLSSSLYATEYMAGLADKETQKAVSQLRKAGIHACSIAHKNLPDLINKNEEKMLDLTTQAHHQEFHVSFGKFDHAADDATQDLKILESALSKIRFEVTGVCDAYSRFCVLTLNPSYIDTSKKGLSGVEKNVLSKYIPKHPHLSLYKWLDNKEVDKFEKEEGNYKVFDKALKGKSGNDFKMEGLQNIADVVMEVMEDPRNKQKAEKLVTSQVQSFLQTVIGTNKSITIGEDDDDHNVKHRLEIKQSDIDNNTKNIKAITKKIMDHHYENLHSQDAALLALSPDQRAQALRNRLIGYMNSYRLFANVECKDQFVDVEKATGSAVNASSMKILLNGMNDFLKQYPMTIKLDRVSFSTEPTDHE